MNLLDVIEKSVGNEYFGDGKYSELLLAMLNAEPNIACFSNQSQQPNSNKIVMIH